MRINMLILFLQMTLKLKNYFMMTSLFIYVKLEKLKILFKTFKILYYKRKSQGNICIYFENLSGLLINYRTN